jgi:hypothetical protein
LEPSFNLPSESWPVVLSLFFPDKPVEFTAILRTIALRFPYRGVSFTAFWPFTGSIIKSGWHFSYRGKYFSAEVTFTLGEGLPAIAPVSDNFRLNQACHRHFDEQYC